jgi:GPI ethanolamine phosphate transferase 3 subunit O
MADPPSQQPKVFQPVIPKAAPGNYNSIAAQYARAKAAKEKEDEKKVGGILAGFGLGGGDDEGRRGKKEGKGAFERLNEEKERRFRGEWGWVVGFWVWLL